MCSVDAQTTNVRSLIPATTEPLYAGCKRPYALTLAVYDPAAAEQRANAASSLSADGAAAQLVLFITPPAQAAELPINAVPLAAVAPGRAINVQTEPWWLRKRLLPYLGLRLDLPVHFIGEKAVTVTDLDPHQNRFRLPTNGVLRNLRPILSATEREAANLLHEEAPRPRLPKQQHVQAGEQQLQGTVKKRKRQGKKHGGLPVLVVDCSAGIRELQLSRWESSRGTIIKGDGYMDFIARCGFKQGDVVEIWVFKERHFRFFGVTICDESPLYVVVTKKEQQPAVRIA